MRWSEAENEYLRAAYPAAPMRELVARLGRSVAGVHNHARALGLSGARVKDPHARAWPAAVLKEVRRLHARGLSDAEIGRRMPLFRDRPQPSRPVHHIRAEVLGLPRNEAALLAARRRAAAAQARRLRIAPGGGLRALAYRRYARECGWPEDLPPRAVQVLNVLAERGPQTKLDLARALGMPADRLGANGSLKLLTGSAHSALMRGHGSYTGLLLARGLVAQQHRSVGPGNGSGRRGSGRLPSLYILTPAAIELREANLERHQRERAGEAGVHGPQPGQGPGGHAGPGRPGDVGRADEARGAGRADRRGREGDPRQAGR